MSLTIHHAPISGPQNLSGAARLTLAFIDGGLEWLNWAAGSGVTNYRFPDESALVEAVQLGLHAYRFTLLPRLGLLVGPLKLMTLQPDELAALAQEETGTASPAVSEQAQMVLSRHALIPQSGFDAARSLLSDRGVASSPIFQSLSMEDLIGLHALLDPAIAGGSAPAGLLNDAAAFAVVQARTPLEFADYYLGYLGYVIRLTAQGSSTAQRSQMVSAALETLLPLLFGLLDCPQVGGLVPPAEVNAAVGIWLRDGRQVGFARLSQAAANILSYSNYAGGDSSAAQQTISDYMASWTSFLSDNLPTSGTMGQDGASCVFPVETKLLYGEVRLGSTGIISTRQFRRAAASPPAPQPTQAPAPIGGPQ